MILKPFYKNIYFRMTNNFFRKDNVKFFLSKYNINWLTYQNLDHSGFHKSFPLRRKLEENFISEQLKNGLFIKKFINFNNLNDEKSEKLNLTLRGEFAKKGNICFESTSLMLLECFFPKNKFIINYYTYYISSYLLLKKNNFLDINVNSIHCFFFKFDINRLKLILINRLKLILNEFVPSFKKNKNSNYPNKNLNDLSKYKFAYFPHSNLRYGVAYNKTFIYEEDDKSKLYKKNVLTLFLNETDALSARYLKIRKIPYFNIKQFISKRFAFIKTIDFLIKNFSIINILKNINIYNILLFIFYCKFLFDFYKFKNLLSKMSCLKAIYVYYDILFPKTLALVCELEGVKTVSHQARTYQYAYFSPLFFNYYLVSGDFKNLLPKYSYAIDSYVNMGIIGAYKIHNTKINNLNKELINLRLIQNKKKIILCVGLFAEDSHNSGLEGNDGTSMQNNIDFVKTIYDLSCEFKLLHFIIRFKNKDVTSIIPEDMLSKIIKSNNIEINNNLNTLNIYDLTKISDFIIGKQTSLLEEALSAGKKVVFYDNENHFKSMDYVLNQVDISEKNFDGLKKRINYFLSNDNNYFDVFKNEKNDYFSINKNINSLKVIKDTIKNII